MAQLRTEAHHPLEQNRSPPVVDGITVTTLDDRRSPTVLQRCDANKEATDKRLVALREARALAHRRSLEDSVLRGSPAADVYVRKIIKYFKMIDIDLATPDAQFLDSPAALSRYTRENEEDYNEFCKGSRGAQRLRDHLFPVVTILNRLCGWIGDSDELVRGEWAQRVLCTD